MLIDAVIFDMDGLMLDTEPVYRSAWVQTAAECGYELTDDLYWRTIGRTRADSEQLLVAEFGPAFPMDEFRLRCRTREATAFATVPMQKKHGLDELLALLDSRRVRKAVATSTERQIAIRLLESAGLLNRFDVIATGDEVELGKPAPDLFRLAAARLGVNASTCLVLEDATSGVRAAHHAGMQVFFVRDLSPLDPAAERFVNGKFPSLVEVARLLRCANFRSRDGIWSEGTELINTNRLTARPLASEDAHDLSILHFDPEVMKTLGGVRSQNETRQWLRENLDHWNLYGFGLWTFRDKTDGRFVGRCGLRRAQVDGVNHVELAYALAKRFWGMGLATEMAAAAVAFGFEELGLEHLIVLVDGANTVSRRVAEKLGFRFERIAAWKSLPTLKLRLERREWKKPPLGTHT